MSSRFARYELRTTDLDAARAFYAKVSGERASLAYSILPEPARALGAVPHWLGQLSVPDVDATTRAWVELGAQRLGPSRRSVDGFEIVALRDPFGAVIALTSREPPEFEPVVWRELNVTDQERAFAGYAERFGWQRGKSYEVDPKIGLYQEFSYGGGPPVGGMLSSAKLPGIHSHWLYYFEVSDLDAALAEVEARRGTVVGVRDPSGDVARHALCEDFAGAIFGLREARR
jgi:predicted enzyme related to lactoylglutathione lyase